MTGRFLAVGSAVGLTGWLVLTVAACQAVALWGVATPDWLADCVTDWLAVSLAVGLEVGLSGWLTG